MLPEPEALQLRVVELFAEWRVPPGPPVTVRYNARLRSTAGRAFLDDGLIELNPSLLEAVPRELPVVLVHEAAHIAVHRMFGAGVPAHGRHWRALMRLAGLPPDVTHDLPLPAAARQPRRWLFLRVCDVCGDRWIGRSVRYGECSCGAEDRFLVLRSTAGPQGLATLRQVPLEEVRRRCRAELMP